MKLLSGECHNTSLIISQHWFRLWLGAVRQQAITWANVDLDLCRHMTSQGHNELIHKNTSSLTLMGQLWDANHEYMYVEKIDSVIAEPSCFAVPHGKYHTWWQSVISGMILAPGTQIFSVTWTHWGQVKSYGSIECVIIGSGNSLSPIWC